MEAEMGKNRMGFSGKCHILKARVIGSSHYRVFMTLVCWNAG